jgi:hypothetical protein
VEEQTDAVEVEVVTVTTRMAIMPHPHLQILPITVQRHQPIMDAVDHPTITHTDTPRTLLGHHHSNNTVAGMVRVALGHSLPLPTTAGTLTPMAAVPHRGRFRAHMAGADITLVGPQVEADTVVAVPVGDMAAAAVGVMDMDMAEEASTIIHHHIRADIVLAVMTVAIVLGVADRREDVAEAEDSEVLTTSTCPLSTFYLFLHIRLLVQCFV